VSADGRCTRERKREREREREYKRKAGQGGNNKKGEENLRVLRNVLKPRLLFNVNAALNPLQLLGQNTFSLTGETHIFVSLTFSLLRLLL
jgi:hypothetical protein